jgi:hypothetical protein
VNEAENDSCCRPVIGRQLVEVEHRDHSWFFRFGDDLSIATESPWRLLDVERIVVTSEDHGHRFALPEFVDAATRVRSLVAGRSVEAASISRSSGDLTIEFGGQVQLELLQMSAGYESWRLSSRSGETICLGGGRIVHHPGTGAER